MTTSDRLHLVVIEHEADASVGRLAPHLADHRVTMVCPADGDGFPVIGLTETDGRDDTDDVDGVIVLGGSMGAYEEDAHPWLVDEKRWITNLVAHEVPVLGICLGAQLLADATGGRAFRSERRVEAGVYQLHLTETGRHDPVAAHAGAHVFAVHGDTFELPPEATLLARTDDYQQIFRIGSALGVQFHPETDASSAIGWASALVAPVLNRAEVTLEQFTAQLNGAEADLAAAAHDFFAAWLDQVANERPGPG